MPQPDTDRTKSIRVSLEDAASLPDYEVRIEAGALDRAGAIIADACPAHRYAIVTDSRVAELYARRLLESMGAAGLSVEVFTFPAGEWNKTREMWRDLSDRMLEMGLGRDAAVVAFGGGVTGDLAGFVAATYMRGLPVIQVPTTLLAMIDSAVGGKTGVDTRAGKNLVGAFHQPSFVLIDPAVLATLPAHQYSAGLAEAIKHGLVLDAEYFEWIAAELASVLQRPADVLARLVHRSVELKAHVVGRDACERGYRQILNFGHTVGHALEAISGYELLHGEAVAIGLVAEALIGERIGVTRAGVAKRVREVVQAADLPCEVDDGVAPQDFFDAVERDKKRAGGQPRYALLADIGRVAGSADEGWSREVPEDVVREVLFEEPE